MKQKSFIFLIIATYSSEVLSTNEEKTLEGKRSRGARQEAELLESAPQAKKASYGEQTFDSLNLSVGRRACKFISQLPEKVMLNGAEVPEWNNSVIWHNEKIGLLQDTIISILRKNKKKQKNIHKNILLANLDLVFKEPMSNSLKKNCIEIPALFMSGWKPDKTMQIRCKSKKEHPVKEEFVETVRTPYLNFSKLSHLNELEKEAHMVEMHKRYLINKACSFDSSCRHAEEDPSSHTDILFMKELKSRIENAANGLIEDLKNSQQQRNRCAEFRILDSEQALLGYLCDDDVIDDLLNNEEIQNMLNSHTLSCIIINIVSLIETCMDCTTFYTIHIIKNLIAESIRRAISKRINVEKKDVHNDFTIKMLITSGINGKGLGLYDDPSKYDIVDIKILELSNSDEIFIYKFKHNEGGACD